MAGKHIWSNECRDAVNKQINMEMHAHYVYTALGHFFERNDVSLKKVAKYFRECAEEELKHANSFIAYQNLRGGSTVFTAIEGPGLNLDPKSFSVLDAMKAALALEEKVNKSLIEMHTIAQDDPEFQDYIEANYLHEQVEAIHELKGYITNLNLVGSSGLGVYTFDKEFRD